MKALPAQQRRAVLAHERSHLDHRHHLHVAVVAAAAALNPLLWRVPATTRFLVERWADEDSARATSREHTARALVRLAGHAERPRPVSALAAATAAVGRRIAALHAGPQAMRPLRVAAPGLLVLGAAIAAVIATDHVWDVFRLAIAAEHNVVLRHH